MRCENCDGDAERCGCVPFERVRPYVVAFGMPLLVGALTALLWMWGVL